MEYFVRVLTKINVYLWNSVYQKKTINSRWNIFYKKWEFIQQKWRKREEMRENGGDLKFSQDLESHFPKLKGLNWINSR